MSLPAPKVPFSRAEVEVPSIRSHAVMFDDDPNVEVSEIRDLLADFGMQLDLRVGFGAFSDFWDDSISNVWVPKLLMIDLQLEGTPDLSALGRPEVKISNEQEAGIVVAHSVVMENPLYSSVPIMFVTNYPNVSSIQAHKDRRDRHSKVASARKTDFSLDAAVPLSRWFSKTTSSVTGRESDDLSAEEYEELWRSVCGAFELKGSDQLGALGLQESDPMDILSAISKTPEVRDRIEVIVSIGHCAKVLAADNSSWFEMVKDQKIGSIDKTIFQAVRHGSLDDLNGILCALEAIIDGAEVRN